ncbi:hypothetical protein JL475_32115 [Streptomyces sp. M2CJ-2]|nr:hypothetical protein [Streptomyces sp. M2CJ-2]
MRHLAGGERSTPLRLAVNSPMVHRPEQVIQATDVNGQHVVHLAEGRDADTQLGRLPPEVAVALAWQGPVQASLRRPCRPVGGK